DRVDDTAARRPVPNAPRRGALTPPAGHPSGVWDELVSEGKLRHEGHGIYSLAGEFYGFEQPCHDKNTSRRLTVSQCLEWSGFSEQRAIRARLRHFSFLDD